MYLFFVRRFNDIDHIVPIVWRMAETGDRPLAILCTTPDLDLSSDFRLAFLAREHAVQSLHLAEASPQSATHRAANSLVALIRRTGRTSGNLWNAALSWQAKHCTREWAIALLDDWKPRAMIYDWCKVERTLAAPIVEAARERSIPQFAVPHGVNYMTNDLRTLKSVRTGVPSNWGHDLRHMDCVVVQHRRHGEWMTRSGVPAGKIKVLGSTRFCREWRQVYERIMPIAQSRTRRTERKLRVVYFDHTPEMRLNVREIERSLAAIVERGDVDLVIKATTGSGTFSSAALRAIEAGGNDLHSNELVEWADVVMGTTSSILLEALLCGKPLLYPRYFHENRQLFDDMGACLPVDDHGGLMQALDHLKQQPGTLPYPQANVDSFLEEVIYGGQSGRDVLGEYRDAIVTAARASEAARIGKAATITRPHRHEIALQ